MNDHNIETLSSTFPGLPGNSLYIIQPPQRAHEASNPNRCEAHIILGIGIDCRPEDVGKFAGGLTANHTYILTPDGGISEDCAGSSVHTCIRLFESIDEAAEAVMEAWETYGDNLQRDIVDVFNNNPVGAIFRVEREGQNTALRTTSVYHEQPFE